MKQKITKFLSRNKYIFLFCLFILTTLYSANLFMAMQHEYVHSEISRSYGILSEIKINYLPFNSILGSTIPLDSESYKEKCTEKCIMMHNLTDVVGYHLFAFVNILLIIFFMLITVLIGVRRP